MAKDGFVRIAINKETEQLLLNEVKTKFLKYHPEFKDIRLSRNFLIRKIADSYLR